MALRQTFRWSFINVGSDVISCPIPRHTAAPGSTAHIVYSTRTICNLNPRRYGISCAKPTHSPKLLVCACERCVLFSTRYCFILSPRGGTQGPNYFPENAPATEGTPWAPRYACLTTLLHTASTTDACTSRYKRTNTTALKCADCEQAI